MPDACAQRRCSTARTPAHPVGTLAPLPDDGTGIGLWGVGIDRRQRTSPTLRHGQEIRATLGRVEFCKARRVKPIELGAHRCLSAIFIIAVELDGLVRPARVPLLGIRGGIVMGGVPGSLVGDHRFTSPEDRHE